MTKWGIDFISYGEVDFFESEMKCRAEEVSWAELNKINNKTDDFLKYYGNYMPDGDSTEVYALFGRGTVCERYCVKIG